MQEVEITSTLSTEKQPARKLNGMFYDVYAIEDSSQNNLYDRLAQLVKQLDAAHPSYLIESLAPSTYEEGSEYIYTLLVTVAH